MNRKILFMAFAILFANVNANANAMKNSRATVRTLKKTDNNLELIKAIENLEVIILDIHNRINAAEEEIQSNIDAIKIAEQELENEENEETKKKLVLGIDELKEKEVALKAKKEELQKAKAAEELKMKHLKNLEVQKAKDKRIIDIEMDRERDAPAIGPAVVNNSSPYEVRELSVLEQQQEYGKLLLIEKDEKGKYVDSDDSDI